MSRKSNFERKPNLTKDDNTLPRPSAESVGRLFLRAESMTSY
jgi:hypothetical protein